MCSLFSPVGWRDSDDRKGRYSGKSVIFDVIFKQIKDARPENASEIKSIDFRPELDPTAASSLLGPSNAPSSTSQQKKNQKIISIKQLFSAAPKFQKNFKRYKPPETGSLSLENTLRMRSSTHVMSIKHFAYILLLSFEWEWRANHLNWVPVGWIGEPVPRWLLMLPNHKFMNSRLWDLIFWVGSGPSWYQV